MTNVATPKSTPKGSKKFGQVLGCVHATIQFKPNDTRKQQQRRWVGGGEVEMGCGKGEVRWR